MKRFFVIAAAIVVAVLCVTKTTYAQNEHARPAVGWDSLKSMIVYPEIARRAGVEGLSNVAVKIDASGTVVDIIISGYDIFDDAIEQAVKKISWIPEMENGKAVSTSVFFDVQFQYRNTKGTVRKTLVIEAEKPVVNNNK
ncbi:MAG: energy transducer TonB [Ignavibacteriales bacterium]|nr:energy transducer TonB [Ignavibacteriales bacterium]